MKKIFALLLAAAALSSCQSLIEEWQPVFTGKYEDPAAYKVWDWESVKAEYGVQDDALLSVAQLCARYKQTNPFEIKEDIFISGIVTTTDQPGNFYKSLYIQDQTGGIEIKIGKNGLYNDYLPGQRLFIHCKNLTLGCYGYKDGSYGGQGMIQLGGSRNLDDEKKPADKYETSYIENAVVIEPHILRGAVEGLVEPALVTTANIPDAKKDTQVTNSNVGKLVTIKGLKYADGVFVLLYPDSNLPHDSEHGENRVFLSQDDNGKAISNKNNWKVFSWAMSKENFLEHLDSGVWDHAEVGSGGTKFGPITTKVDPNGLFKAEYYSFLFEHNTEPTYKDILRNHASAYSVSQYFTLGSVQLCIRTSGFCKFPDKLIPQEVLDGTATLDVTGILSIYEGTIQIVVNNISDFVVNGKPLE